MRSDRHPLPSLSLASTAIMVILAGTPARSHVPLAQQDSPLSPQNNGELRAVWVDAFHTGFRSAAEIDTLIARALQGNYNTIFAEVMAHQDNAGGGHGAYWNSAIVPAAPDITSGLDPLAYLCQQAHASGLEVHTWLVAFRVSSTWPPAGNSTLASHPEWLMVNLADIGAGPAKVDGYYVLDPGSPDVQDYLMSIVSELVSNYPIDGVHWDYVRYTSTSAGYPADTGYAASSLARFQQITGYVGTPPTTEPTWNDFRRRTITEHVRRARAEVALIGTNPQQPLRHSAALITWGDAPTLFENTNAYNLFQDWRHWLEKGYLDAGVPMTYYDEPTYPTWYRNWVDAALGWRYDRHLFVGTGNYINTPADTVAQIAYAQQQGADGISTFSYAVTRDDGGDAWAWYPYAASHVFTAPTTPPVMPWRDPATATEGTLFGQVTAIGTGLPVDNVTVQVGNLPTLQTDGNGYYTATLVPADGIGTLYDVSAIKTGYPDGYVNQVAVFAGETIRQDIMLGVTSPCEPIMISDFESYAPGDQVMFRLPRFSGTTAGHLAAAPDTAGVTTADAYQGTGAGLLEWAFVDAGANRWLRTTTYNATYAANPTIELDKPLRLRLRVDQGSLRVCLGVRETGTIAEVGQDGGINGTIEWVGATHVDAGCPQDGILITARPGIWQTVIFDLPNEPVAAFTGDGILSSPTNRGTIEHLAFVSTGDPGPFAVYVDNVKQLCEVPPAPVPGDIDRDTDVDADDLQVLLDCRSGETIPYPTDCDDADLDADGDVDLDDFGIAQRCLSGTDIMGDPQCSP